MIENTEELQGQLIASGNIVASMINEKGDKGDKGDTGETGQDGVSPIITTSKQGKVTTLTIVDAEGTKTATILDGSDGSGSGDMLKSTYDQNENGIVDNAEKVNNHTVLSDVPANAVFTDTTYTAGTGIEITAGNVINNTQTSAEWGNISGTLADQTDLNTALGNKIDKSNTTGLVKNDGTIDTTTYSTFSGSYNDLSNKPTIPDELADLSDDSTHRVVTDTEKNTWSGKQDALVSGTNIKTINSTSLLGSGNLDVGASIPVQDTAPLNPSEDDLWIDTSDESGGTNILDVIFPVGSIVIKADNEDYSSWLGFTWERTLVGRVAVGIDSTQTEFDTIGETGGEKTHTLTINEIPSHRHDIGSRRINVKQGTDDYWEVPYNSQELSYTFYSQYTGGGQGHNIMNPYQVVAYWKRTA